MGSLLTPASPDYGHRLLPVVIDEAARNEPDRIFFYVPRNNQSSQGYDVVTASAFANSINRLCWWFESHLKLGSQSETIAYLGQNDLRYFIMMIAAVKTGHKLLLSSPRNNVQAHQSLIKQSGCKFWITASGIDKLDFVRDLGIPSFTAPELSDLLNPSVVEVYSYEKQWEDGRSDVLGLLHTSGSTGLPKLVPVYLESLAAIDAFHLMEPINGKRPTVVEWTGTKMLCAMPLFHVAGAGLGLGCVIFFRWTIVFPPTGPIMQHVIEDVMDNIQLDSAFVSPSVLQDMSKSPRAVDKLSKLKFITTAGGPVPQLAGEVIHPRVPIWQTMGMTEGQLIASVVTHPDEWAYFNFHPQAGVQMRPYSDSLFELVFVKNEKLVAAQAIFITFPHLQAYETKDLYSPHPTIPNLWRYEMRRDDLIVLSNGEKFNPLAAEQMLTRHPSISAAYITGRGRFQAAALLYPDEKKSTDNTPNDENNMDDLSVIDNVWPTIENVNKSLPAFAQIHRDMIMIVRTPFPRTPKGTLARNETEKRFSKLIDELYERSSNPVGKFSTSSSSSFRFDGTSQEAVLAGVREALQTVSGIGDKLDDDDNIFTRGFDSLHAIRIVRLLNSATYPPIGVEVGTIYMNPSIGQLGKAVWAHLHHELQQSKPSEGKSGLHFNTNTKLITSQMLTKNLPHFEIPRKQKEYVVITGTTGSIGPYLLDMACKSDQVAKVWCINRSEDAPQRQVELAQSKGLSLDWNEKVQFIHYDFTSSKTPGLDAGVLEEIKDRATIIIHNAWEVNFNIPLSSFEPQFTGLRHLVDICRETRHKIQFYLISSISTAMNWSCALFGPVPEAKITDLNAPINGYGASKLVAEHLLGRAAQSGTLSLSVLRVGQVAGPVKTTHGKGGMWPRRDWVPAIIDASAHLELLPSDLGSNSTLDFIPVDLLAEIIGQLAGIYTHNLQQQPLQPPATGMVGNQSQQETYYNLLNPQKTSWGQVLPHIKARLEKNKKTSSQEIRIVPFQVWVNSLRDAEPSIFSDTGVADNKTDGINGTSETTVTRAQTGYKLLSFFQMMADGGGGGSSDDAAEKGGDLQIGSDWAVRNTLSRSSVFADLAPVSANWFDIWLEQWGY